MWASTVDIDPVMDSWFPTPVISGMLSLVAGALQLEVDAEPGLRPGLEVVEDRGQKVIFEPLLVIAVRRPQANAALDDAQALDRPQPQVPVCRLDLRLDGTDRFAPEFESFFPQVQARKNRSNPHGFPAVIQILLTAGRVSRPDRISTEKGPEVEARRVGNNRGTVCTRTLSDPARGRRAPNASVRDL
jgi:hypothetical protein